VIAKSNPTNEKCIIHYSNSVGKYEGTLNIDKFQLADRMDFQFWKFAINMGKAQVTLKDLGVKIERGKFSHKELREKKISYFHTIHFTKNKILNFEKKTPQRLLRYTAKKGDILLSRVGKGCIGKVAKIGSGAVVISDCIFRLSAPSQYRRIIWLALTSMKAQDWFKAYAHGVCSQVISKCDLENFPVSL
jgi:type I restriction enzyme M protein